MYIKDAAKDFLIESPRAYRPTIEQFSQLFNGREVVSIIADDYYKFWDMLKEKCNSTTIKWKLTIVKVFLRDCVSKYGLRLNTRRLKIPKTLSRRQVCTVEEYKAMCSVLNPYEFYDLEKLCMLHFMAMGMRVGEVRNLNVSDFQLPKREAIIMSEKSRKERYIAWNSDETHALFTRFLAGRICMNQHNHLFIGARRRDKRISIRTLERWFNETRVKAGVTRVLTPHTLRHMAAHQARDKGADLRALQEILGHTNPMSTNNYTNLSSIEALESVKRFSLV